ncbi:hypothetical protein [Granulicella paludicola]|uniref:hypothetical protein n=1 Tax=Granulicella paludicola TaxID=474951 RepID=UPI0021DF9A6D|nr:hypothetical protein [Granulicella paludicola]
MSVRAVVVGCLMVGAVGVRAQSADTTPPVLESGQTSITQDSGDKLLTPEQEKQLLASEDKILHFVSKDTQLPILAPVKVRFVSRDSVAKDLRKKFDEDKGAKRMERSELVLKKFGLLDQSFQLKPFLLSLLTEQIAGFYDNKTKMMNLLNWVPIDEQAPVMAHELTHALQDQKVGLTKWDDNEIEGTAKNSAEDTKHIAVDETDTAREAVLEGQAMVSFADYALETNGHPGKTLKDFPQMADQLAQGAGDSSDSPVLSRAPLVLQQSLLFPYTNGLTFEQVILTKDSMEKAFAGVLQNPPSSSYEIMTPEAFRHHLPVALMRLPDVHPMLKDAGYDPYDVGVMGELDVRMTAELFGGRPLAEALAPAWDGGVYYAAQRKSATAAEKSTTASIALLYSSQWKNDDSAHSFFDVFEQELPRQYDGLKRRKADEKDDSERVYSTKEGDVLLTLKGKSVWVSEGFELPLARKLRDAVDEVNVPLGHGPVLTAGVREQGSGIRKAGPVEGLSHFMGQFGMMRVVLR